MDLFNVILGVYVLGAVSVGVFLIREYELFAPKVTKKGKVGPCYWGAYEGASAEDAESEKVFELRPASECSVDGLAGSGMYAKGSAVKSAR